jgi:hypothetical protein
METPVFWDVTPSSLVDIYSLTLDMEAACSSETSVNTYPTTYRYIPPKKFSETKYFALFSVYIQSLKIRQITRFVLLLVGWD